jgi:hypothetical protein
LAATPAEIGQQITAAGDEARRQDRATLHQAQETLQRAAGDLRGWVNTARLARLQNWRLLQVALASLVGGGTLGMSLLGAVVQVVPEQWAWPEKSAARVLHRDMWSAGERMLLVADAERWRRIEAHRQITENGRDESARCTRSAGKVKVNTSELEH